MYVCVLCSYCCCVLTLLENRSFAILTRGSREDSFWCTHSSLLNRRLLPNTDSVIQLIALVGVVRKLIVDFLQSPFMHSV